MKYKGIICAMITPFDENQNINSQATCQLIDYLIEKEFMDYLFWALMVNVMY